MLFYRHADEFYHLRCIYIDHSFISSSDDRVRIQNENHETDKYLPDKRKCLYILVCIKNICYDIQKDKQFFS